MYIGYTFSIMPKKERTVVFIDGSNFYNYLKNKEMGFEFNKRTWFNYKAFVDSLIGNHICVAKRYYIGIFRNFDGSKKSKKLVEGQQKFHSKLEENGFIIVPGRIIYDAGKTREKGTDVAIALDLAMGAVNDSYDTAILISSDTDLVPALRIVQDYKKRLEYVGFSHKPSFGIQKNVHSSTLLNREDIEKFTEQS